MAGILKHISERPLKRSDRDARAETGAKRPLDVVQRLRRPAAPSRLRARAESAPAIGRDERSVIGVHCFYFKSDGGKRVAGCGIVRGQADA